MVARRTGRSTDVSITIYTDKIPTQQKAYKVATKNMAVQIQNLVNANELYVRYIIPWLNAKGIIGSNRLIFRQAFFKKLKFLNTKQGGNGNEQFDEAIYAQLITYGVQEDLAREFVEYLKNITATTHNYVIPQYGSGSA